MYSLADYLWMIADGARVSAYAQALRAQLQPGARVLEVGAGFGFFSVIAAQAGASHVDAVDINPVIHLGPKVAAANGCADRITFHHLDLTLLTLERPADLLLVDLRGPTPFGRGALDVIMNARDRLLRTGGVLIAARDTLFAAPCAAPAVVRREVHAARGQQGVVLDAVERVMHDTPMRYSIMPGDLLAEGKPWLEIDYRTVDRTDLAGSARWLCDRSGSIDGLAVWFEADLGGGVKFSTAPGSTVVAYKQLFVPFRTPVAVKEGDALRARLAVREVRGNTLWDWQVWLRGKHATAERHVVRQNSLAEIVIDPAAFGESASEVRPSLGRRGEVLRRLLDAIDGQRTIGALAEALRADAPELFASEDAAHEFVAGWTQHLRRLERGAE